MLGAIDRMYATGLLEGVWPRVTPGDTLVVRVVGQPRVAFTAAAAYDNDRGGRAWGLIQRHASLARRPALLSAAIDLGGLEHSASASARIYANPASGLAWSIGAFVREHAIRAYEEDVIRSSEVWRSGGWIGVDLPHILQERHVVASVRGEFIDEESGRGGFSFGPMLRWTSVQAPGDVIGIPTTLEAEQRFGEIDYSRLQLSGSHIVRIAKAQVAALADLRAVSSDAPADVPPALGDDHMIPGLRWGQMRGPVRAVAGLDAAYPIGAGFVRIAARTGAITNEIDDVFDARDLTSGALIGVIFPTPLGALDVSYGISDRGTGRFDISIGQRF